MGFVCRNRVICHACEMCRFGFGESFSLVVSVFMPVGVCTVCIHVYMRTCMHT